MIPTFRSCCLTRNKRLQEPARVQFEHDCDRLKKWAPDSPTVQLGKHSFTCILSVDATRWKDQSSHIPAHLVDLFVSRESQPLLGWCIENPSVLKESSIDFCRYVIVFSHDKLLSWPGGCGTQQRFTPSPLLKCQRSRALSHRQEQTSI